MGQQPTEPVTVKQVYLRLATPADVPQIKALTFQLARFERMEHECSATDTLLLETLFDDPTRPPFKGPTVVILEVGSGPEAATPAPAGTGEPEEVQEYQPRGSNTDVAPAEGVPVEDEERNSFVSVYNPHRTVAAFALAFPNFSSFLARPGLYLEALYVREPYRRLGFGTCLLRFLARMAFARNMGRLDWSVAEWNEKAITFYTQRIGAKLMEEWRICRLKGATLEAAAKGDQNP